MSQAVTNCLAQLQNEVHISDYPPDTIPDYIFEGLAMYVAPVVSMEFGRSMDMSLQAAGLQMMRAAVVNKLIAKQTATTTYF